MNFKVADSEECLRAIDKLFAPAALVMDRKDGLSASFDNWRFNIRLSNTETLVRLNVETKGDSALLIEKTQIIAFNFRRCIVKRITIGYRKEIKL